MILPDFQGLLDHSDTLMAVSLWCPTPGLTHRNRQHLETRVIRQWGKYVQESHVMKGKPEAAEELEH
jgi:hypothetical protein